MFGGVWGCLGVCVCVWVCGCVCVWVWVCGYVGVWVCGMCVCVHMRVGVKGGTRNLLLG